MLSCMVAIALLLLLCRCSVIVALSLLCCCCSVVALSLLCRCLVTLLYWYSISKASHFYLWLCHTLQWLLHGSSMLYHTLHSCACKRQCWMSSKGLPGESATLGDCPPASRPAWVQWSHCGLIHTTILHSLCSHSWMMLGLQGYCPVTTSSCICWKRLREEISTLRWQEATTLQDFTTLEKLDSQGLLSRAPYNVLFRINIAVTANKAAIYAKDITKRQYVHKRSKKI